MRSVWVEEDIKLHKLNKRKQRELEPKYEIWEEEPPPENEEGEP